MCEGYCVVPAFKNVQRSVMSLPQGPPPGSPGSSQEGSHVRREGLCCGEEPGWEQASQAAGTEHTQQVGKTCWEEICWLRGRSAGLGEALGASKGV